MNADGLPPGPPGHLKKPYVSTSHLTLIARSTILAHPLLRILYVLYEATTLSLVRVPFWFFQYLIPRFRPQGDPRNVFTLVWIRIIQRFLAVGVIARITPAIFHTPPRWSLRSSAFVYIPVLADRYLKYSAATPNAHGVVIPPSSGQPGDGKHVPAFWYAPSGHRLKTARSAKRHRPAVGPGAPDGVRQHGMCLYLHGGAYVGLTTHEADPATALIKTLTNGTQLDVLALEYRLASIEAYPAQLQDAAAAWVYLVSSEEEGGLGIPADKIVLVGDSAGANLVIALLRWLDEMARAGEDSLTDGKGRLGKPRAAMLLSPWLDLSASLSSAWQIPDIVSLIYGDYGRSCLLRTHHPSMVYSPLISPYFESAEELSDIFAHTRVYIAYGGSECLRPEIESFIGKLRAGKAAAGETLEHEGVSGLVRTGVGASYLGPHKYGAASESQGVVVDFNEGMPHDWPTIPFYGTSAKALWTRVGEWTKEILED